MSDLLYVVVYTTGQGKTAVEAYHSATAAIDSLAERGYERADDYHWSVARPNGMAVTATLHPLYGGVK